MNTLRLKRFIRPEVLRAAGRDLIDRFLQEFHSQLTAAGAALPATGISDEEYFCALATMLLRPETVPPRMNEALLVIEEMATPEGQERLETALEQAGVEVALKPDSSRLELALQVWLAAPELLVEQHTRQRMRRLSRFEYFAGPSNGVPTGALPPPPAALDALEADLDRWFFCHQRGRRTTRVQCYVIDGEYWFLVRHGDTFTRAPAVEERRTHIVQFRPERDDVVVYCAAHNELRVNARNRSERNLYREEFGALLHGNREYFSAPGPYTLEPLRTEGADALRVAGENDIRRVRLRELKVLAENGRDEFTLRGSQDLFFLPDGRPARDAVPQWGRLAHAVFDFEFADSQRPFSVELRPPNVLKVGRHCDARVIGCWFCRHGFRVSCKPARCRCGAKPE